MAKIGRAAKESAVPAAGAGRNGSTRTRAPCQPVRGHKLVVHTQAVVRTRQWQCMGRAAAAAHRRTTFHPRSASRWQPPAAPPSWLSVAGSGAKPSLACNAPMRDRHRPARRDYPTKISTALESNQFTFGSNYNKSVRMDYFKIVK